MWNLIPQNLVSNLQVGPYSSKWNGMCPGTFSRESCQGAVLGSREHFKGNGAIIGSCPSREFL